MSGFKDGGQVIVPVPLEFTGLNTIVAIAMLALYDEFDTYWQNGGYKKLYSI